MRSAVHSRFVRRMSVLVLAVAFVIAATDAGHAQFVLYDDFSGGAIDPERWTASAVEGAFGSPTTRVLRVVENGSLRMALASWGGTASDSGFVTTRERLSIRQLGTLGGTGFITGMQAKVTVLNAEVQDCPANPDVSAGGSQALRARALMNGWFFNTGSGGPSDRTGNITTGIQLTREPNGANTIRAFLQRCEDAGCNTLTSPVPETVFTTQWSLNTPLVLELAWDNANGKFVYTVTNPATLASESKELVYQGVVTNAGPPTVGGFNALNVQNSVKNCTAARKRVVMDALFDDVQVRRQP